MPANPPIDSNPLCNGTNDIAEDRLSPVRMASAMVHRQKPSHWVRDNGGTASIYQAPPRVSVDRQTARDRNTRRVDKAGNRSNSYKLHSPGLSWKGCSLQVYSRHSGRRDHAYVHFPLRYSPVCLAFADPVWPVLRATFGHADPNGEPENGSETERLSLIHRNPPIQSVPRNYKERAIQVLIV